MVKTLRGIPDARHPISDGKRSPYVADNKILFRPNIVEERSKA